MAGCSAAPTTYLHSVIESKNFIPFQMPLESTRVGTILRGSNKDMRLIAPLQECFPDMMPEGDSYRWVQKTSLPSQSKKIQLGVSADLQSIALSGNEVFSFNAGVNFLHSVEWEFKGATIEFFNEGLFLKKWLEGEISGFCRLYLKKYPFIGVGLRVEEMSFKFQNSAGGYVNLKKDLENLMNINPGVNWYFENEYTLKIETPKYIGYKMARLNVAGDHLPYLEYANSVDKNGNWEFYNPDKPVAPFSNIRSVYVAEPLNQK